MQIIYDTAGETYTILRIVAPVGTAFSYTMREEFDGTPDSIVHYHAGRLHRFCPDAMPCNPQGAGLPADPFSKIGTYHFIVSEPAEWDCISPMAAFPVRVVAEQLVASGPVGGDVYLSAGRWSIEGVEHDAPLLLTGIVEGEAAILASDDGLLFHHIHTVPLEA